MDYGWQTIKNACPSKSNCYKIITIGGHSSLAKTKSLKDYENDFFMQCGKYRNLKIDGYFEYHCKVFYPSMRSDLDNSLKIQLDCLQKTKTITNDNKCVKIVAEKFIDKENPRVEFRIVTID
jgi:Holliday junction resolvase RusA-like endonuclease